MDSTPEADAPDPTPETPPDDIPADSGGGGESGGDGEEALLPSDGSDNRLNRRSLLSLIFIMCVSYSTTEFLPLLTVTEFIASSLYRVSMLCIPFSYDLSTYYQHPWPTSFSPSRPSFPSFRLPSHLSNKHSHRPFPLSPPYHPSHKQGPNLHQYSPYEDVDVDANNKNNVSGLTPHVYAPGQTKMQQSHTITASTTMNPYII